MSLALARLLAAVVVVASLIVYSFYLQAQLAYTVSLQSQLYVVGLTAQSVVPLVVLFELPLALVYWITSAYLVYSRPQSRMVLLVAVVGVMIPSRVAFMQVVPLEFVAIDAAAQVERLYLGLFGTLTYIVFAIFPDGRFVPTWTRWWVAVRVLVMANYVLDVVPALNAVYVWIDIGMFTVLIIAQYQRFHGNGVSIEKQQTKWTLLGITVGLGWFFMRRVAEIYLLPSAPMLYVGVLVVSRVALLLIPLSITFALLRYRLYDVDWVLNRSLVYGTLTLLSVSVFTVGLVASQVLVGRVVGESQARLLVSVGVAIGLVSLYTPLYQRIQSMVDRRFFRLRSTPDEIIDRQTQHMQRDEQWSGVQLDGLVVGELVGKGSMGRVYDARYQGRRVAVKLLPRETADDEVYRGLIQREMRLFQDLSHPNICQMVTSGFYRGTPYIVMEYLDGQELEHYLEHQGVLSLEQTRLIVRDIAAALDYVHAQNLLHRDIKPRNIILQDMRAVLTDFGMARHISGTQGSSAFLLTTPDYAAPEQITQDSTLYVASDIYSLGVVVYRMVTGQKPFEGSLRHKMLAILNQPPRDPRELNPAIPESTALAILKALAKTPAERFASAGDFARAL